MCSSSTYEEKRGSSPRIVCQERKGCHVGLLPLVLATRYWPRSLTYIGFGRLEIGVKNSQKLMEKVERNTNEIGGKMCAPSFMRMDLL